MATAFRPDPYSVVARHLVAPLWAAWEGTRYLSESHVLERMKYRPLAEVRADQCRRAQALLSHAYENTAFYRHRMEALRLSPKDFATLDDLRRLPLLTKDDIRNNLDAMLAITHPRGALIPMRTSGSTGVALRTFMDVDSQQWKRADALSYDRWARWDIGQRIAAIWTTFSLKRSWRARLRNLLLERYTFLDTLTLNEDSLLRFYTTICRERPTLLYGHAHSLYLFARFLQSRALPTLRPRGIISTCMVLHTFERSTIENVFQCAVTDRYGCEEVSLIACECSRHSGLHLNYSTLIVELLNANNQPAEPGEPGAIIVTDLTNYGMPFIRYKVGDVGVLSPVICACGCTYPLLESLQGRVADYIVTPEGQLVSGISLDEHFFMHLPAIKQLQFVQKTIDHIELRIVPAVGFSERTVTDIADLVRQRFGPTMKHSIQLVDSIPQEPSGKYRFCISNVPNPFT